MAIIVIDYSGTLVKASLAEEANLRRYEILGIEKPSEEEHKKHHATKGHYEVIKEYLKNKLKIPPDAKITYAKNHGDDIELSGKEIKTSIMTDLFRLCTFQIAAEQGQSIFPEGMLDALAKLKEKGYKLAIVSGTRSDIITGTFAITNCPLTFDYVYGQDPILSRDDKVELYNKLKQQGEISFIIGDKMDDLKPAKELGAKTIFVKWGHPAGGEEEFADFSISDPKEILEIIK